MTARIASIFLVSLYEGSIILGPLPVSPVRCLVGNIPYLTAKEDAAVNARVAPIWGKLPKAA